MNLRKLVFPTIILLSLLFYSCETGEKSLGLDGKISGSELYSTADGGGSGDPSGNGNGQNSQAGVVTAGEWNDLDNWNFWKNLLNGEEFSEMPAYWDYYTNNRIAVLLKNEDQPQVNVKLVLKRDKNEIWETYTNNKGEAELWIGLNQKQNGVDLADYKLTADGVELNTDLMFIEDGVNEIIFNSSETVSERVEISFIVDATGSMSDELEFLKDDLEDVIQDVESKSTGLDIYTSGVFYRDEGDEYITRKSGFSGDLDITLQFINKQSANGGGDFPEAVHTALDVAFNELQWSENARARIAFLLLDAPPHYSPEIKSEINLLTHTAAKKGIRIIPVTASGIDKNTEFLMRFIAMSTNGSYVFITNDSGVGNDHLVASVGEYEVELLNDLMARLISEYTE